MLQSYHVSIGYVHSAHWNKMNKESLGRALAVPEGQWWPVSKDGVPNKDVGTMISQEPMLSFRTSIATQCRQRRIENQNCSIIISIHGQNDC